MNGKRSLSPSNTPNKSWKQQNGSNGQAETLLEDRRKLPMWSAKESFLKEISKYV